jgi:hypothetical protein
VFINLYFGRAMARAHALLAVCLLGQSAIQITAKALDQGLTVLQPAEIAGEVPHTEASFGTPQYGASITGRIYYEQGNYDGCSVQPVKQVGPGAVVMIFDRGNCTFVQKVRNAEAGSANAVIIADNVPDGPDLIMADDGTGTGITIPALFVNKLEGNKLKDEIRKGTNVMVKLRWAMPAPDNHVEWSLWTSSNDPNSIDFKNQFKLPATLLGPHHTFEPHYLVIAGNWFDW